MGKKSSLRILSLTDFPNLLSAYVYIHRFSYNRVASDLGVTITTAMNVLRSAEPFKRRPSIHTAMFTCYPVLTPRAWESWQQIQSSKATRQIKELQLFKVLEDLDLSGVITSYLIPGNTELPGIPDAVYKSGGTMKLDLTVLERNLLDALSTKVGVSRADLIRKCLDLLSQQHPDALESAFKMASYEVLGTTPREGKGTNTTIQISRKARDLLNSAYPGTGPTDPPRPIDPGDLWDSGESEIISYVDIFYDSEEPGSKAP